MDDDSSDLSSLSYLSSAPSDEGSDVELKPERGILKFFHKVDKETERSTKKRETRPKIKAQPKAQPKPMQTKLKQKKAKEDEQEQENTPEPEPEPSPEPPKRPASPPHEYTLADNPDIAMMVMFRSRFNAAFPKTLVNFGPQEIEQDVVDAMPGDRLEHFLCAVLSLLLNRKQDVKPGHYQRALEDAISSHKNQWPLSWGESSPLSGGKSFTDLIPSDRLTLLRALILWSLSGSEAIKAVITQSYKQARREDDLNQPLSVQPWGIDSDKRRYYLIEGLDDTNFRIYRESNPASFKRTWWSVAGTIPELQTLSTKLSDADGGPRARKLAAQMLAAIPRFEAAEEKRKRRDYRLQQKNRFKRPEPGFSLYEGRTRGKRMKYTFSDDEEMLTDSTGNRRSTRNTRQGTPSEPVQPVTTASGRQVKAPSRMTVDAANNIVMTNPNAEQRQAQEQSAEIRAQSHESSTGPTGRPQRLAAANHGINGWPLSRTRTGRSGSDDSSPNDEPDLGDDEEEHVPDESEDDDEEENFPDEDEKMSDDESGDKENKENKQDSSPRSRIVTLKIPSREELDKRSGRLDRETVPSRPDFEMWRFHGDSMPGDVITAKKGDVCHTRVTVPPGEAILEASLLQPGRKSDTTNGEKTSSTELAFREGPEKSRQSPPASAAKSEAE